MGADTFAQAAGVVTVICILALIVGARWVAARDERRDENLISTALVGLTVVGVAVIILAALSGPHLG